MPLKKIMLTSRVFNAHQDALKYAQKNDYCGVEWYLNKFRLVISSEKQKEFFTELDKCPDFRFAFHLPTNDIEIGHANPFYSETSLKYLMMYIDFLRPWLIKQQYRPIFTMHIGANSISMKELNWDTTRLNLKKLGKYILEANGCLCLENLKKGWTAEPKKLVDLVKYAKINITFDSGHAASSPLILKKELTIGEYINQLKPFIHYIHLYSYETLDIGRHMPPKTWEEIKNVWEIVKYLPEIKGITLELTTLPELEHTYNLLKRYTNF